VSEGAEEEVSFRTGQWRKSDLRRALCSYGLRFRNASCATSPGCYGSAFYDL